MNPYTVLGVDPKATDVEIRRAYVALARRFHPDTNPAGEERMRAVNEAWAVLGDQSRRAAWDRDHRPAAPDLGFRPDDPTDDGFDPRAQPDVPYRPPSAAQVRRHGARTMAPLAGFCIAAVTAGAGIFFGSLTLLMMGVVLFSLAGVALVVTLLLTLVDARRDEG